MPSIRNGNIKIKVDLVMLLLLNNSDKLKETLTGNSKQELFFRLKSKGMKKDIIPSYIRSMRICLVANPVINYLQMEKELKVLGWHDFELDYHTLKLAVTCFETERIIA